MDHYEVLQVRRDAEPEVIEKAYKALSMKYHPDRAAPTERQGATRRMQRINVAYGVLRDSRSRALYDAGLRDLSDDASAWEQFLDRGLVGLFWDWYARRA